MTTMETKGAGGKDPALPPTGEHVVVHCLEFSCLGYRDEKGIWKNVFSDKPLANVINFSPIS